MAGMTKGGWDDGQAGTAEALEAADLDFTHEAARLPPNG